jgi:mRNA interferase MazF
MKRSKVIIVAATGDYGKSRHRATDAFSEAHESVVICQMTSEIAVAPDLA